MKAFVFTFCFLLAMPGISQNFKNEFGFRSDNDAYLAIAQDQYYTNGLFITYRHALKPSGKSEIIKKIWEAEAGQYMYNATSGSVSNQGEVDRPFAAYLYGQLKMNWFKENEQVFQTGLQIGTIGPKALGKEAQETLHNAVGFYSIDGWQYQVKNETGVNGFFNYSTLLARKNNSDFSLTASVRAGNTFAGAGASVLFRTGQINKLFNSVSTNSRISNSNTDSLASKEMLFYLKPSLNFIAYNATIQGGMFVKDKGPVINTPNRVVFSQELGVMYAKNHWTFDFSLIFQTKEIKTQEGRHQYGSASIYYRF